MEFTCFWPFGKRLGLAHWQPTPLCAGAVDVLVIGDSYADDIDMGFYAYPSKLAQLRGWSCLNVARGGSESRHGIEQYHRAVQFVHNHHLHLSQETLCIVHLGGNDALHALWLGPLAALAIYMDIFILFACRLGLAAPLTRMPRFSFFGLVVRQSERKLGSLVQMLAEQGHRRILVSGSPLCSSVPTARAIIGFLLCSWAWPVGRGREIVTYLIDEAARVAQRQLFASLRAAAESACTAAGRPDTALELVLFDEAQVLRDVCSAGGTKPCWRDGHHPQEWVHAALAQAASRCLGSPVAGDDANEPSTTTLRKPAHRQEEASSAIHLRRRRHSKGGVPASPVAPPRPDRSCTVM